MKKIVIIGLMGLATLFTGCNMEKGIEKYATLLYQVAPEGEENAEPFSRDTGVMGYQVALTIEGLYKEDGVVYASSYHIKFPFGYRHGVNAAIRVE